MPSDSAMAAPEATPAVANKTQSQSRRVSSLGGLHVLCIDNDPAILQGMAALLGNWQCDVTAAESLEDARLKLNGEEPDIILADYQLDDNKNGLDAMDALRAGFSNDAGHTDYWPWPLRSGRTPFHGAIRSSTNR